MTRKILSGTLIILSFLLLCLSIFGIGAAWYYNEPFTNESMARLAEIDDELEQAQNALVDAQGELTRALRIVESAEESLEVFSEQRVEAIEFLDAVTGLLDDTITPGLKTSKEKLAEVEESLNDLYKTVEILNKIPLVNIEMPDKESLKFFSDLTDNFEKEIDDISGKATEAATFLSDSSYFLGGDLQETKESIDNLMAVVGEYERKIGKWREDIATLTEKLPRWLDHLSVFLAVFLLWFAFSQVGLLLHGLASWRGEDASLR